MFTENQIKVVADQLKIRYSNKEARPHEIVVALVAMHMEKHITEKDIAKILLFILEDKQKTLDVLEYSKEFVTLEIIQEVIDDVT